MPFESEFCVSVDADILSALAASTGEDGEGASDVLEQLVKNYVAQRTPVGVKREKRDYLRFIADIPTVIEIELGEHEIHYRSGRIMDISMGGVRLALHGHERIDEHLIRDAVRMELFFKFPEHESPHIFVCEARSFQRYEGFLNIGAMIVDADFTARQDLHKFCSKN
jgi:hypothetical protein